MGKFAEASPDVVIVCERMPKIPDSHSPVLDGSKSSTVIEIIFTHCYLHMVAYHTHSSKCNSDGKTNNTAEKSLDGGL